MDAATRPVGRSQSARKFTNKYEQSTPFERPQEFEGRKIEDVIGAGLAGILAKRDWQVIDCAAGGGPLPFRDPLDVTKPYDFPRDPDTSQRFPVAVRDLAIIPS